MTKLAHAASGFAFDVVGVGALNLDYIAGNSGQGTTPARSFTDRLSELLSRRPDGDAELLEWGVEHRSTAQPSMPSSKR